VLCGVAIHILTLMQALPRERFRCELVLLRNGRVEEAARDLGIPCTVIGRRFAGDPATVWRLHQFLRGRDIKIVHTHTLNGNYYGCLAALIPPQPIIVTSVHTFLNRAVRDFCASPVRRWLLLRQNLLWNKFSSCLVTPSEAGREMLMRQGVPASKLHVVHNGIALADGDADLDRRIRFRSRWGVEDDQFLIGAVGRFVPQKNLGALLRILVKLRERQRCPRLMLVGEGPERDTVDAQVRRLGLENQVIFTGWQPLARDLMPAFDLFVLPSLEENFPYAVLEAMAAGRPVITFDTGALAEIVVDGVTGFLVRASDEAAMADAIARLMADTNLAEALGRAGRDRVQKRFSTAVMAAQLGGLYLTLLSA